MSKTLEEYVKEYGDYLKGRDKSKATIVGYQQAIKNLLGKPISKTNDLRWKWDLVKTPESLTLKDIEEFALETKTNYQPNTQRIRLSAIKKYMIFIKRKYNNNLYLEYLEDKEISNDDILQARKGYTKKIDVLTKDEIERLFKSSDRNYRDNAIIKTLYYTSQRVGSIVNLNFNDINFEGKMDKNNNRYYSIEFKHTKGNNHHTVETYSEDLIQSIKRYIESEDREEPREGYIYDNWGNKLYHRDAIFLNGYGERLKSRAISNMLSKYAVKCKIKKNVYPHLFRHTVLTLLDGKMSDAQRRKLSGHSEKSPMLNHYTHPNREEVLGRIDSVLSLDNKTDKPKPLKRPEPKPEKPQDTYIAQPQQQISISPDDYKKFIEWKKQQDMMYQ
jgi:integrase/recombinase XerD